MHYGGMSKPQTFTSKLVSSVHQIDDVVSLLSNALKTLEPSDPLHASQSSNLTVALSFLQQGRAALAAIPVSQLTSPRSSTTLT